MLSSDTHVLTPLSSLLSQDREIRDALDRERVRADMAEARVAELEGKLCPEFRIFDLNVFLSI